MTQNIVAILQHVETVGDKDNRCATVAHHRQRAAKALLTGDVEIRVRLVENEKARVAINRARERDALLLPAREKRGRPAPTIVL